MPSKYRNYKHNNKIKIYTYGLKPIRYKAYLRITEVICSNRTYITFFFYYTSIRLFRERGILQALKAYI